MTLRGPWRQLARIVEDDDRLEDVISDVMTAHAHMPGL